MSENDSLLEHVMSIKEAIAYQTAVLNEVRTDIAQHTSRHEAVDKRVSALEVWPTTVRIIAKLLVGGVAFFGSAYGVVKTLQPTHQDQRHSETKEGRVSGSP